MGQIKNIKLHIVTDIKKKAIRMPLFRDLSHPSAEDEKTMHKFARLVPSPNSYFMDVKCPGRYKSRRCSAMHKLLCCVCRVQQYSVSRLVVAQDSPKAAVSERSPPREGMEKY